MPHFAAYTFYIYAAYGITFGVLLITACLVIAQWRKARSV